MKFRIKRAKNCCLYKGHFYYAGQKVNVNIDKLIQCYKKDKSYLICKKTYDYIKSIRKKKFTIMWVEGYPRMENIQDAPLVRLDNFPHYLDTDSLILIYPDK